MRNFSFHYSSNNNQKKWRFILHGWSNSMVLNFYVAKCLRSFCIYKYKCAQAHEYGIWHNIWNENMFRPLTLTNYIYLRSISNKFFSKTSIRKQNPTKPFFPPFINHILIKCSTQIISNTSRSIEYRIK